MKYREYLELISTHKTQSATARFLKLDRSTFRARLARAQRLEETGTPDDAPRLSSVVSTEQAAIAAGSEASDDLKKARAESAAALKKARAETEAMRVARDQALAQLDVARGVRIEAPRPGTVALRTRDDITRVVIPDSHGAHICQGAAAAFLADLKRLDPDEIVMLGDHLDCGGFLAQHHVMGYVADITACSYEEDVIACNAFLDAIQAAAPRAKIDYLFGNHEARVEKWCVTATLRHGRDAKFLLDMFGPAAVLKLKERGIAHYSPDGFYDGLPIPGTIKRGICHFTHGLACGKHATDVHVHRFGASVVHGHTHRAQSSLIRTVSSGVIGAWSPGCLSEIQPRYAHTNLTDWSHGYGLQFQAKSGKFLHLNIPIIGGESLLFATIDRDASAFPEQIRP